MIIFEVTNAWVTRLCGHKKEVKNDHFGDQELINFWSLLGFVQNQSFKIHIKTHKNT